MDNDTNGGEVEITSTDLLDCLIAILERLATGKKHDPSWMRPIPLTRDERRSDFCEANAIIEELRKRSNGQAQPPTAERERGGLAD